MTYIIRASSNACNDYFSLGKVDYECAPCFVKGEAPFESTVSLPNHGNLGFYISNESVISASLTPVHEWYVALGF